MHCYRADEMAAVLDMSQEFGYHVAAFHHAVEAYKIADLLAEHGVCAAMWADWWGFKMEAYDGIPENIAFVDAAPGGCAIVHSDSEEGIQRLNQEAAKAMAYGARAGLDRTARAGDPVAHRQSGQVARPLGAHRHARAGQDGRRRRVERHPFSASTRRRTWCSSTARCATTASIPRSRRARTSSSASRPPRG